MTGFTEQQAKYSRQTGVPTFGDYARTVSASFFDLAGSVPKVGAYAASQFDGPEAQDYEYAANRLAEITFGVGEDLRGMNTEAAQQIVGAAFGSEEFFQHPFHWGLLNVANTAAPIVAGVVGALVAGPTVGMMLNSGLAGVQSAGMTYNDMVKDLDGEYRAGKLDNNPYFKSLVDSGMSEQEALREFKRQAVNYKPAALFAITAALARFSPQGILISKVRPTAGAIASRAVHEPGLFARVGEGFIAGGTEEAAQNTAEEWATQNVQIASGQRKDYDPRLLAEAAGAGFAIGAPLGGVAGIPRGHGALPIDVEEDRQPQVGDPDFIGPAEPYGPYRPPPRVGEPDFIGPAEPYGPYRPPPDGGGGSGGGGATTSRRAPKPAGAGRAPTIGIPAPTVKVPAEIAVAIEASAKPVAGGETTAATIAGEEPVAAAEEPAPTSGIKSFVDITETKRKTRADLAPTSGTPVTDNVTTLTEGGTQVASEVAPAGDTAAPQWLKDNAAAAVAKAEQLGLTDAVSRMATAGMVAKEIVKALKNKLDVNEVRAVRDSLGINPAGLTNVFGGTLPEETAPAAQPEVQAQAQGIVAPEPSLTLKVKQPEAASPVEPIPAPEGAATATPDEAVWKEIGRNEDGTPLYEDQFGNRALRERKAEAYTIEPVGKRGVKFEVFQAATGAAEEEKLPSSGSMGPAFITKAVHQQLADLDYSPADRKKMTPQEAADIIAAGTKKPKAAAAAPKAEKPAPAAEPTKKRTRKAAKPTVDPRVQTLLDADPELLGPLRHWPANIAELDAMGADPKTYQKIMSTGSKEDLKKGETWREKALSLVERRLAREQAKKQAPPRKAGTIKLTPKVAEKVKNSKAKSKKVLEGEVQPKVKTPAAVELVTKGKRRGTRPVTKPPQIELYARERKPELPKPPPPKSTPAVRYDGDIYTGETHGQARAKLYDDYQAHRQPHESQIEVGNVIDGEFHQVREDLITPDHSEENAQTIAKHIRQMKNAQRKAREEQLREADVDVPKASKGADPNITHTKTVAAVDADAEDILKHHLYNNRPEGLTDAEWARQHVAEIAETAKGVEAQGKKEFKNYKFGRVLVKNRPNYNWLVRALRLNDLFKGIYGPKADTIEHFLNLEETIRLERKAGNAKADPFLDESRGQAGGLPSGGNEEQILAGTSAPEMTDEEIRAAEERYAEGDEVFSAAFEQERQGKRGQPPVRIADKGFRPKGVKLREGRSIPVTPELTERAGEILDVAAQRELDRLRRADRLTPKEKKRLAQLTERGAKSEATKARNRRAKLNAAEQAQLDAENAAENARIVAREQEQIAKRDAAAEEQYYKEHPSERPRTPEERAAYVAERKAERAAKAKQENLKTQREKRQKAKDEQAAEKAKAQKAAAEAKALADDVNAVKVKRESDLAQLEKLRKRLKRTAKSKKPDVEHEIGALEAELRAEDERAARAIEDIPLPSSAAATDMAVAVATEDDPARVKFYGENIDITHPRGSERNGVPEIAAHYGEFVDRTGVDGQPLDAYVGQHPESATVFVIRQMKPGKRKNSPAQFDENKVMLAFASAEDATTAYKASVPDIFGEPSIETLTVKEFQDWVKKLENTRTGEQLNLESNSQEQIEESQLEQRAKGTSIYDQPFTPKFSRSQLVERALRKNRDIAPDVGEKYATDIAEDVLGETPEPTTEPPAAKKGEPLSGAENKSRIAAGVEGGWLKSPYVKHTFARIMQNTDVRELLNQLEYTDAAKGVKGRGAILTFLKNRLIKAVGDTKIFVISNDDLIKFQGDNYSTVGNQVYDGIYVHEMPNDPNSQGMGSYIIINDDLFGHPDRRIAESVLHEIVHAATVAGLKANPQLDAYLRDLMGAVMRHHGIIDPNAHYGFTNVQEFVAEGITNPAFQEMLASTPLSRQMARRLGVKMPSQIATAWHGFLSFVAKSLKLPPNSLSVLHALTHVTERLMTDTARGVDQLSDETRTPPIARKVTTPKAFNERVMRAINEQITGEGRQRNMSVPKLLKLAGLDQLARSADRFWRSPDNPIRKIYRHLTNISEQTAINEKKAEKLIYETLQAERSATRENWHELWSVMSEEQTYNVYADRPLASQTHLGKDPVNKPTMKGAQAVKNHAQLEARLNALPENLREIRLKLYDFMRNRQRSMAHMLVYNWLVEGLRGEKNPEDITDALVFRIVDKQMTDEDKKFIGNSELVRRIVRAKELYHTEGPYFPKMRRGDWVVRAQLKVEPPDASLNGTLQDGTENVYEFRGKDARKRAMDYAASQEEKAWVSGITVDETTGESWEVLPDDSEIPGTRKKITMKDANSVRVFRVEVQNDHLDFFDTQAEAEREAFDLESDPDILPGSVKGVVSREFSPGDRGIDFQSSDITQLMRSLEKRQGFKDMHPAMQHELRMAAQEFALQMMGSTRVHKRRIQRRHVRGESADITRGLVDYAHATSSYLARLDFAPELNDTLREMKASIDAGHRAGTAGRQAISNEVLRRIDSSNGFQQGNQWYSPLVQRLLTTSFIARLGSPMYTMMNLLQVGMVSMPIVAARHKVGPTVRAFSKAYRDIGAGAILGKGLKETYRKGRHPEAETENFIDDLKARLTNPRERELVKLITMRGGLEISKIVRSGKGYDKALAWGEGIARQLPTAAEVVNRAVVLLAAYRLEYAKNGGNHKAAMRYADDTNNMTNFNYSEVNAPPIMNHPLAKLTFQFKRFGHGMYQLLGQQIGRAWRNENPGDRAEALKSLAYIVATHTLMAGTLGLPTEIPKAIVIGAFAAGLTGFNWQDVEDAERALAADWLGPDMGEALTRGITRTLPFGLAFDLSPRVGMADMFLSREPNSGDPQDIKNWLMEIAFGAPGSMLFDFQKGGRQLVEGDYGKALQNLTPVKGLRDIIRAVDTGLYGKKTSTGRPSMAPYGFAEAFIRALGATPEREAETQELQAQFYSQQAYISAQRGKLERQWAEGSTADRIRMRGALERFNRDKPEEAQLKTKELNAYAKRQKTDVEKMVGGVTASKANRYVVEQGLGVYNAQ